MRTMFGRSKRRCWVDDDDATPEGNGMSKMAMGEVGCQSFWVVEAEKQFRVGRPSWSRKMRIGVQEAGKRSG